MVALERFLAYLKDGVIVGHHTGHDVATLAARHGPSTLGRLMEPFVPPAENAASR